MEAVPAHPWSRADEIRRFVAPGSLVFAVVAIVADRGSAAGVGLSLVPVVAFAAWSLLPRLPLAVLTIAVLAPVIVVQRSGHFEPLFFEASLLAYVVGFWSSSVWSATVLGVLAAASPGIVSAIQQPSQISVGIWVLGIIFPWAMGRVALRQTGLAAQLEATRERLAEQALLAERRRIARDVHDLVGHGLAAVMLQLTSARHVLRRDPSAAEEALRSAEEVGRRSMQELRRTVALLRSDEDGHAIAAPVPTAAEIPALIDDARAGGLPVELRIGGDLSDVAPGVGIAAYRIAQEALANAARHAPRARTMIELERAEGELRLTARTTGPAAAPASAEPDRPRYGVVGMHERAAALGGELEAGPTADGWLVRCRLPLEPAGVAVDPGPPARG